MMTREEFHNGLRILHSVDEDEFVAAGIAEQEWMKFDPNPVDWTIRASDADYARLWTIIEARQRPAPEPCIICGDKGWRPVGEDNRRVACVCRK